MSNLEQISTQLHRVEVRLQALTEQLAAMTDRAFPAMPERSEAYQPRPKTAMLLKRFTPGKEYEYNSQTRQLAAAHDIPLNRFISRMEREGVAVVRREHLTRRPLSFIIKPGTT